MVSLGVDPPTDDGREFAVISRRPQRRFRPLALLLITGPAPLGAGVGTVYLEDEPTAFTDRLVCLNSNAATAFRAVSGQFAWVVFVDRSVEVITIRQISMH
jgi:hypothetical protein